MMGSELATKARKAGTKARKAVNAVDCPILDQMTESVKVLIGEIKAGNTSINLRNELSRILLTLYKSKRITKAEYSRFATL